MRRLLLRLRSRSSSQQEDDRGYSMRRCSLNNAALGAVGYNANYRYPNFFTFIPNSKTYPHNRSEVNKRQGRHLIGTVVLHSSRFNEF
ncbi:hypothetical protein IQ07DRAFT_591951 [Pyrenochaeta sp. DS3sAY3a]|nr:hypothetical protein IQ07DRAFT_591951 [Pyrenochaeta sp. DS3sAY3a]